MNVPYEAIGKGFVQQYYALFDDPAQRPNLINMYNVSMVFSVFSITHRYIREFLSYFLTESFCNWHNLSQTETSFMTFEGIQLQGAIKIMEKLTVSKIHLYLVKLLIHNRIISFGWLTCRGGYILLDVRVLLVSLFVNKDCAIILRSTKVCNFRN